jgi:acyl-CoA synthetase (AMP-forming)/AMP-acid ligase II
MAKPGGHKDVAYLVDLIAGEQITTVHFVPSMLQMFLSGENVERCNSLRRVLCSGEALPYSLQERFFERLQADLHNLYGPTEAAVDVTYWQCRADDARRIVPIGRPVANTQMYVLDEAQQPVPVGVVGELYIGGVQVGRGYHGRPDLTAERFIERPLFDLKPRRLYRTGDLGRWLPDGTLEYLGRTDGQVKVRGVRMELSEIEAGLQQHEAVREAVVLLDKVTEMDRRLVAYFTVKGEAEAPAPSELRQHMGRLLPDYMIPAVFVPMPKLPLSPSGKVDRKALPRLEEVQVRSGEPAAPPENDTERAIAGIWGEVLRVETVGANDNIFDLGGNSLLLLRINEELRTQMQVTVSVVDLFRFTTVRRLAQFLAQRETEAGADRARGIMDRVARQRSAFNQQREKKTGGR